MNRKLFDLFSSFLLFTMLLFSCSSLYGMESVRIGIVTDGPYWENPLILKEIKNELNKLAADQFLIQYPKEATVDGQFNRERIRMITQAMLSRSDLNLILAVGHHSSLEFARAKTLNIPVVAVNIQFPIELGLLDRKTLRSNNPNWTTSYDPSITASALITSQKLIDFEKLTYICSSFLCGSPKEGLIVKRKADDKATATINTNRAKIYSLPTKDSDVVISFSKGKQLPVFEIYEEWMRVSHGWVHKDSVTISNPEKVIKRKSFYAQSIPEFFQQSRRKFDFEAELLILSPKNFQQQLNSLETDVAIVGTLEGFSNEESKQLFNSLTENKIPNIAQEGIEAVHQGAMISISEKNYLEIGRTYAIKINSILNGIPPNELSVFDQWKLDITFNQTVGKKIGFGIPMEFLYEARIVETGDKVPPTPIQELVNQALENNHEILIDRAQGLQVEAQVGQVKSGYMPQLNSSLSYTKIDNKRADLSPSPRTETKLELQLSQNLWNPELSGKIDTVVMNKEILESKTKLLQEDLKERVILAVLDLLKNNEIVKVRKEHLRNYRKLRDIAQLRFSLKETGKGDVLRVNMQYESGKINMINALELRYQANVSLNDLLQNPKEQEVRPDPTLTSAEAYEKENELMNRFRTKKHFNQLQEFLLTQMEKHSLELQLTDLQLQQAKKEREEIRAKFLPKVQAGASWFRQLTSEHRDFENSIFRNEEQLYEDQYTTGWSVQVKLTYPIFSGGIRFKEVEAIESKILEQTAKKEKTRSDLAKKSKFYHYNHLSNRQRVSTTQQMLKNSRENLELGRVSYLQGSIPIMDLLDLQSNVILSEINSIEARFQFYNSLVRLMRTIGKIDLLLTGVSSEHGQEFVKEVDEFINSKLK